MTLQPFLSLLLLLGVSACSLTAQPIIPETVSITETARALRAGRTPPVLTETVNSTPFTGPSATPFSSATPTASPSITPSPTIESLEATVTANLLSCRYGPGAEYLFLYALRLGAQIRLIGRADGNNWVWVDGENRCWVNVKFLEVAETWKSLPVVYPGLAELPVSPYYPPPAWAKATREGDRVQIFWEAVPISAGKYEDQNMHQYLIEVWRCEKGQILFETLGTNLPFITIDNDEPGCSVPSHGNVWVQEKHGFAGPTEIPWPPAQP